MPGLKGVRVLLVEDEALLLIELQDILADLGAVIVGSAAQVAQALDLAHNADFDVAILDVNLGSQRIDGVAKVIAARGIPLVFATGYGSPALPPAIKGGLVEKPYDAASLESAMACALADRTA